MLKEMWNRGKDVCKRAGDFVKDKVSQVGEGAVRLAVGAGAGVAAWLGFGNESHAADEIATKLTAMGVNPSDLIDQTAVVVGSMVIGALVCGIGVILAFKIKNYVQKTG